MKQSDLTIISRILLMSFILLYSIEALSLIRNILLLAFLLINYLPALIAIFRADKIIKEDWEDVIAFFAIFFLVMSLIGLPFWVSIIVLFVFGAIVYYFKRGLPNFKWLRKKNSEVDNNF